MGTIRLFPIRTILIFGLYLLTVILGFFIGWQHLVSHEGAVGVTINILKDLALVCTPVIVAAATVQMSISGDEQKMLAEELRRQQKAQDGRTSDLYRALVVAGLIAPTQDLGAYGFRDYDSKKRKFIEEYDGETTIFKDQP